jgi:hypothetical protein
MDSSITIRNALDSLLAQPDDAGSFVIIEDEVSQKFVQFVGSIDRPLLLDLPAQTFSEAEFYRAVAFFKRRGVVGQEFEMLDAPGGQPVGEQFTFQLQLESVSDAIEVVRALFAEVYRLPDCRFHVITS